MGILKKMGLRGRLVTLFLAVALVSIAVVGFISYASSRAALQKEIADGQKALGSSREAAILIYLQAKDYQTEILSRDRTILTTLESVSKKDPNSTGALKELNAYLKNLSEVDPTLYDTAILDMQGRIIAAADEQHLGQNKANDEYFLEGKKGTHIKDAHISDITNKPTFTVSTPIHSANGKEVLGVLVNYYSLDSLNEICAAREGLGETGEVYIVNKDGYTITESRFNKGTVLKQKVDTEPVRMMMSQEKEFNGVYPDYRGQLVLGSSDGEHIKAKYGLHWAVLSEEDVTEAFAPIKTLGLRILLIAIVIAALVSILAWFVASGISVPILQIAERVSSSSQQLSSTAQELNATTEEVSTTVQQIAKGTETQAQKVEETKKAMEQMSAAVEQVSKSAQNAASQAQDASKTAQTGGGAVKDAQTRMLQISDVVLTSATAVKKLSERSEQVSEIVKVITNIADQTNLLALNAAIEAARAGEYGRGFAVVAEEVRKLAEASAKSADEIEKLIKDVQKETTQAVSSIEGATKEVSAVKDIAQKLQEGLANIIKNAETVATMAEQVSAASEQQASGVVQVSKSVSDIAAVAEQSASATQEASASTEEMTASMEQMAASAQELADMGVQLFELVGRKRVRSSETKDVGRGSQGKPSKFAKLREQAGAAQKRMGELRTRQAAKETPRMAAMDVSSMKAAHMAWKGKLKGFLEGKENMPRELIASHTDCDLGKWLSNVGAVKCKDMPEMKELQDVHRRFHYLAGRIANSKNSGDIAGVETQSGELESASRKIISLLGVIEEKV